MLLCILLLAALSNLSIAVQVTTTTFRWDAKPPITSVTPRPAPRSIAGTKIQASLPKPHFPAGWRSPFDKAAAQNTSVSESTNLASGFGDACCGWGGLFGWNGQGSSSAIMAGGCGPNLPLSTLDLNQCISWNPNTGGVYCSNSGGFTSNSNSGCKIVSPPSVWGQMFDAPTYTQIIVACNGPAANTGYITTLDLRLGSGTMLEVVCPSAEVGHVYAFNIDINVYVGNDEGVLTCGDM
ncbi:hypothetical protein CVT26_006360 [Gymnopilus dilepis]|uniref:Cyanovirin-N domain-containing protein n=1 Tax=Gymnopilus dilepis TaxID=231916 RepID=A0A409Y0S7_9AGAR|nr:hypothetical protein CVT26_006360 [Gymnopilus dilepis]